MKMNIIRWRICKGSVDWHQKKSSTFTKEINPQQQLQAIRKCADIQRTLMQKKNISDESKTTGTFLLRTNLKGPNIKNDGVNKWYDSKHAITFTEGKIFFSKSIFCIKKKTF